MDLSLSWDLFIIAFFAIILAYSFIVGRKQTIKIIIATYIAFLTSDALGYFIRETVGYGIPAKLFGFDPVNTAIIVKILIFIGFIVIISRHEFFNVNLSDDGGDLWYLITTSYVAFLSAILIIAGMLYYVSGDTLVSTYGSSNSVTISIIKSQSAIVKKIMDLFYIWLFLPSVSVVALMFFNKKL